MKPTRPPRRRGILALLALIFLVAAFFACQGLNLIPFPLKPVVSLTPPSSLSSQAAAFTGVQATLTSGQGELAALSGEATMVSLGMAQAANAAAQATLDADQQRLAEIAARSTQIAHEMAAAAATQSAIVESTRAALEAASTGESLAVLATQSALEAHVYGDGDCRSDVAVSRHSDV